MKPAAILLLLLAGACGLPDSDTFGPVPTTIDATHLRWCNSGEPDSIDPAIATTTNALKVVYALFDGPTNYGLDGLPEPGLATSWDVSDDLRRFTFHVRDNAQWSNGRAVDAYDIAYQIVRVLHPSTASPNADQFETMKNAVAYNGNAVRVVMRDVAGFHAGDIVDVVGTGGKTIEQLHAAKQALPDSNEVVAVHAVALRDLDAAVSAAYAHVPAGTTLRLIELSGRPASPSSRDGSEWAYVFWDTGDGVYGWVPRVEIAPKVAAISVAVHGIAKKRIPGVAGDAPLDELAADTAIVRPTVDVPLDALLLLPEALGVRVPDAHTLVLETTDPTPYVISMSPGRALRATPREAVSRWPRRWTDPEHIVTSGPMHLSKWVERDYLEMTRAKNYWNAAAVRLQTITVYSLNDQSASANYYYSGGCDAVTSNNIPGSYLPAINGERGKRDRDFYTAPYLGIYFAFVNTKKVDNVHLRRALSYAIDRSVMPAILHAGQQPTAQLTPGRAIRDLSDDELKLCGVTRTTPGVAMIMITGQLCYVPPPGLDFDPSKAKSELAIARRELGARFPETLTYRYNSGTESHKQIAEYLQASWKKVLNLDIELESQEWKTFISDTRKGNYELARFGNIGNYPDAEAEFLPNFRCASQDNRAQWCDPEFEAAMDAARPIRDRKARLAQIAKAEKILIDAAPVIPLFVYTQFGLQRPYVKDLAVNFPDQPPLARAYIDPAWTTFATPVGGAAP